MADYPEYVNQLSLSAVHEQIGPDQTRIAEIQLNFSQRYVSESVRVSPDSGVPSVVNAPVIAHKASVVFRTPMLYQMVKLIRDVLGAEEFDAFVQSLAESR